MTQLSFSQDWLNQLSDPYAILGLSVAADERRLLKRYRTIAKLLHPDSFATSDVAYKELASQIFARLVNPAYQTLKQESDRTEILATLRLRARGLSKDAPFSPKGPRSQALMRVNKADLDVIYEQAVTAIADAQYQQFDQFSTALEQLDELHVTYLYLKIGEPVVREKRTGIVSAAEARTVQYGPMVREATSPSVTSYAQRHYQRAEEYIKKANWSMAVQELRDAIRIEPNQSDYHATLAKVYLMQNLTGMAKIHFRQALKFNPEHPVALEYAKKLDASVSQPVEAPVAKSGGFFGLFAKKR